jgi:DNA uptake protein ComE-like DNA-binding protein
LTVLAMLSLAGGMSVGHGSDAAAAQARQKTATLPVLIDINSASPARLQKLPGIGAAEAERIVAGRPYLSKAGLVTASIIPAGVYQSIRQRIIAIQHSTPKRSEHHEPMPTD